MKKTVRALGILLSFFAVLAFASPAFACGGGKKKDKTAQKDSKEMKKQSKKAEKKQSTDKDEEPS